MKHIPLLVARAIKHNKQQYDTCGNYGENKFYTWFQISRLRNWKYEVLILVHEIIEYFLCKARGIKVTDIDNFDLMFEAERRAGKWINEEPGFDKRAPYLKEHTFATKIEKMLCKEFGLDWENYIKAIDNLKWKR